MTTKTLSMIDRLMIDRRRALGLGAGFAALAAAGPAFAQKAKPIKVAAIYTVPVEQQWVSRIDKALKAAQARGEVTYKFSENVANTDYERVMRQYAQEGNDLVVGEAFAVERAARKVAADYPKTAFLMGSSFGPTKPNFAVFDNWIHEPSYLTGMVAGKATKSNVIGMVGGYAIPEVNRLMQAFMDGAKSVNPNVKFIVSFINSWYDPPKAKEAAFAMIDKGADILYAERFGVADAAKERKVKAIGNVIDTSKDYPGVILASALWHMEPTIDRAIKAVIRWHVRGDRLWPVQLHGNGGASLAPLDTRWFRRSDHARPGEGEGDHRGPLPRRRERRRAEVTISPRAYRGSLSAPDVSRRSVSRSVIQRAGTRFRYQPSYRDCHETAMTVHSVHPTTLRANPRAPGALHAPRHQALRAAGRQRGRSASTSRHGEIVALLGENGAGKTTLMNIIFGHYVADEGEVLVADGDGVLAPLPSGSAEAALRAGVGMVHQHFTLAENLSGIREHRARHRAAVAVWLGGAAARARAGSRSPPKPASGGRWTCRFRASPWAKSSASRSSRLSTATSKC